uniref:Jacalin-type lectin domain-containing protein n=1 Tax=Kalanchoe fedtschenkoi TaxID=63787 RepID=A0A7N0TSJ1_KALFE
MSWILCRASQSSSSREKKHKQGMSNKDMKGMIKLGPTGSQTTGQAWDEKGQTHVYQILLSYEISKINGLQIQYVKEGSSSLVLSDVFGSMSGPSFKSVKLDYPSEYLTWVKVQDGWNSIDWVAFKTNLGKLHGPFPYWSGKVDDCVLATGFHLGDDDNQFGGFHGTADANGLHSLGVYVRPVTSLKTNSALKKHQQHQL